MYFAVVHANAIIDVVAEEDHVEQLAITYDGVTWYDAVEITEATALELGEIIGINEVGAVE
jgi:hypothetical protein